ncbi:apolipoprotein N-acyltransferase [Caulobacter sp. NIBR2454]|uniref:apolipoprotein N-acyltransferase n=1 Tax=Caulobacter sp. NIBR2454 TaxID=3015996 RepID=UPI0022B73A51|nr:apolipoprotein N-acyltransferase [Caulobacter sp. NIBR2454]
MRQAWRAPWLSAILSLGAGLAAALAHPPFGILPGLLGYALLLRNLDGADQSSPLSSAFFRGWLAGLAYFGLSIWWVAEAFLVNPAQAWMAPFAPTLLASGLGLFWGFAALVYRRFAPPGARRVLLFAGLFAAAEWLRGHILTGFPWNLPGQSWEAGSYPSQAAALFGAYGLTWVTLAIAASFAVIFEGPRGRIAAAGGLAGLVALYGWGGWRVKHAAPTAADAPLVRIVQADVQQSVKYDEAVFTDIVIRHLRLTRQRAARVPDLIVWPEGAIPDAADSYLAHGTWTREAIEKALQPGQALILGAYRIDGTPDRPIYYNSLISLRRTTALEVTGVYDKHRLTPFGEYLPLESWADKLGLKQMVQVGDGFTPGPRPQPLEPAGLFRIQPLICYESLFPGFIQAGDDARRPRAIVNISNDAWFGQTSGPLQHLNLASYRAIETGTPMIRATPTGVSAMIDAYGRIVPNARLGLGETGVIDAALPALAPKTVYSLLGDAPFGVMILASFGAGLRRRRAALLKSKVI